MSALQDSVEANTKDVVVISDDKKNLHKIIRFYIKKWYAVDPRVLAMRRVLSLTLFRFRLTTPFLAGTARVQTCSAYKRSSAALGSSNRHARKARLQRPAHTGGSKMTIFWTPTCYTTVQAAAARIQKSARLGE